MEPTTNKTVLSKEDSIRIKQGIVTLCVVLLCVIDQIKGSAPGNVQHVAVNCTGFLIAGIILTGYSLQDLKSPIYPVWAGIYTVGYLIASHQAKATDSYTPTWITIALNVGIYGFLLLLIFRKYLLEHRLPRMRWPFFLLWLAMMLAMIFSKNDLQWPLYFLIMFGCFYLTEYTREEQDALFNGIMHGIIIGFVIIQGFATLYRAFDGMYARYTGMYANSNANALFYLLVLVALLAKWVQFHKNNSSILWKGLCCLGIGSLFDYAFITLGRTALMIMVLCILVTLLFITVQEEWHGLIKIPLRLVGIGLCIFFTFPGIFGSVRWVPARVHSPLLLFGDAHTEYKIKEQDAPMDDERYIDLEELLESGIGRFYWLFTGKEENKQSRSLPDLLFPAKTVYAAESTEIASEPSTPPLGSGLTQEDPVLAIAADANDAVVLRKSIYKTYFQKLNFAGHREEENNIWITQYSMISHAHDVYLQMFFSHGMIGGGLFLIHCIALLSFFFLSCLHKEKATWHKIFSFLALFAFCGFGILELSWDVGQLSFTLFFLCHYLMLHRSSEERKQNV